MTTNITASTSSHINSQLMQAVAAQSFTPWIETPIHPFESDVSRLFDRLYTIGMVDYLGNIRFISNSEWRLNAHALNKFRSLLAQTIQVTDKKNKVLLTIPQEEYIVEFGDLLWKELKLPFDTYLRGSFASYVADLGAQLELIIADFLHRNNLPANLVDAELKPVLEKLRLQEPSTDIDWLDHFHAVLPAETVKQIRRLHILYFVQKSGNRIRYEQMEVEGFINLLIPKADPLHPEPEPILISSIGMRAGEHKVKTDRVSGHITKNHFLFSRDAMRLKLVIGNPGPGKRSIRAFPESIGISSASMILDNILQIVRLEKRHLTDFSAGLAAIQYLSKLHTVDENEITIDAIIAHAIDSAKTNGRSTEFLIDTICNHLQWHNASALGFIFNVFSRFATALKNAPEKEELWHKLVTTTAKRLSNPTPLENYLIQFFLLKDIAFEDKAAALCTYALFYLKYTDSRANPTCSTLYLKRGTPHLMLTMESHVFAFPLAQVAEYRQRFQAHPLQLDLLPSLQFLRLKTKTLPAELLHHTDLLFTQLTAANLNSGSAARASHETSVAPAQELGLPATSGATNSTPSAVSVADSSNETRHFIPSSVSKMAFFLFVQEFDRHTPLPLILQHAFPFLFFDYLSESEKIWAADVLLPWFPHCKQKKNNSPAAQLCERLLASTCLDIGAEFWNRHYQILPFAAKPEAILSFIEARPTRMTAQMCVTAYCQLNNSGLPLTKVFTALSKLCLQPLTANGPDIDNVHALIELSSNVGFLVELASLTETILLRASLGNHERSLKDLKETYQRTLNRSNQALYVFKLFKLLLEAGDENKTKAFLDDAFVKGLLKSNTFKSALSDYLKTIYRKNLNIDHLGKFIALLAYFSFDPSFDQYTIKYYEKILVDLTERSGSANGACDRSIQRVVNDLLQSKLALKKSALAEAAFSLLLKHTFADQSIVAEVQASLAIHQGALLNAARTDISRRLFLQVLKRFNVAPLDDLTVRQGDLAAFGSAAVETAWVDLFIAMDHLHKIGKGNTRYQKAAMNMLAAARQLGNADQILALLNATQQSVETTALPECCKPIAKEAPATTLRVIEWALQTSTQTASDALAEVKMHYRDPVQAWPLDATLRAIECVIANQVEPSPDPCVANWIKAALAKMAASADAQTTELLYRAMKLCCFDELSSILRLMRLNQNPIHADLDLIFSNLDKQVMSTEAESEAPAEVAALVLQNDVFCQKYREKLLNFLATANAEKRTDRIRSLLEQNLASIVKGATTLQYFQTLLRVLSRFGCQIPAIPALLQHYSAPFESAAEIEWVELFIASPFLHQKLAATSHSPLLNLFSVAQSAGRRDLESQLLAICVSGNEPVDGAAVLFKRALETGRAYSDVSLTLALCGYLRAPVLPGTTQLVRPLLNTHQDKLAGLMRTAQGALLPEPIMHLLNTYGANASDNLETHATYLAHFATATLDKNLDTLNLYLASAHLHRPLPCSHAMPAALRMMKWARSFKDAALIDETIIKLTAVIENNPPLDLEALITELLSGYEESPTTTIKVLRFVLRFCKQNSAAQAKVVSRFIEKYQARIVTWQLRDLMKTILFIQEFSESVSRSQLMRSWTHAAIDKLTGETTDTDAQFQGNCVKVLCKSMKLSGHEDLDLHLKLLSQSRKYNVSKLFDCETTLGIILAKPGPVDDALTAGLSAVIADHCTHSSAMLARLMTLLTTKTITCEIARKEIAGALNKHQDAIAFQLHANCPSEVLKLLRVLGAFQCTRSTNPSVQEIYLAAVNDGSDNPHAIEVFLASAHLQETPNFNLLIQLINTARKTGRSDQVDQLLQIASSALSKAVDAEKIVFFDQLFARREETTAMTVRILNWGCTRVESLETAESLTTSRAQLKKAKPSNLVKEKASVAYCTRSLESEHCYSSMLQTDNLLKLLSDECITSTEALVSLKALLTAHQDRLTAYLAQEAGANPQRFENWIDILNRYSTMTSASGSTLVRLLSHFTSDEPVTANTVRLFNASALANFSTDNALYLIAASRMIACAREKGNEPALEQSLAKLQAGLTERPPQSSSAHVDALLAYKKEAPAASLKVIRWVFEQYRDAAPLADRVRKEFCKNYQDAVLGWDIHDLLRALDLALAIGVQKSERACIDKWITRAIHQLASEICDLKPLLRAIAHYGFTDFELLKKLFVYIDTRKLNQTHISLIAPLLQKAVESENNDNDDDNAQADSNGLINALTPALLNCYFQHLMDKKTAASLGQIKRALDKYQDAVVKAFPGDLLLEFEATFAHACLAHSPDVTRETARRNLRKFLKLLKSAPAAGKFKAALYELCSRYLVVIAITDSQIKALLDAFNNFDHSRSQLYQVCSGIAYDPTVMVSAVGHYDTCRTTLLKAYKDHPAGALELFGKLPDATATLFQLTSPVAGPISSVLISLEATNAAYVAVCNALPTYERTDVKLGEYLQSVEKDFDPNAITTMTFLVNNESTLASLANSVSQTGNSEFFDYAFACLASFAGADCHKTCAALDAKNPMDLLFFHQRQQSLREVARAAGRQAEPSKQQKAAFEGKCIDFLTGVVSAVTDADNKDMTTKHTVLFLKAYLYPLLKEAACSKEVGPLLDRFIYLSLSIAIQANHHLTSSLGEMVDLAARHDLWAPAGESAKSDCVAEARELEYEMSVSLKIHFPPHLFNTLFEVGRGVKTCSSPLPKHYRIAFASALQKLVRMKNLIALERALVLLKDYQHLFYFGPSDLPQHYRMHMRALLEFPQGETDLSITLQKMLNCFRLPPIDFGKPVPFYSEKKRLFAELGQLIKTVNARSSVPNSRKAVLVADYAVLNAQHDYDSSIATFTGHVRSTFHDATNLEIQPNKNSVDYDPVYFVLVEVLPVFTAPDEQQALADCLTSWIEYLIQTKKPELRHQALKLLSESLTTVYANLPSLLQHHETMLRVLRNFPKEADLTLALQSMLDYLKRPLRDNSILSDADKRRIFIELGALIKETTVRPSLPPYRKAALIADYALTQAQLGYCDNASTLVSELGQIFSDAAQMELDEDKACHEYDPVYCALMHAEEHFTAASDKTLLAQCLTSWIDYLCSQGNPLMKRAALNLLQESITTVYKTTPAEYEKAMNIFDAKD